MQAGPLLVATKEYDALPDPIQIKLKLASFLANLGRHQKDAFPEPKIISDPINT
jgi:hypothetical protein